MAPFAAHYDSIWQDDTLARQTQKAAKSKEMNFSIWPMLTKSGTIIFIYYCFFLFFCMDGRTSCRDGTIVSRVVDGTITTLGILFSTDDVKKITKTVIVPAVVPETQNGQCRYTRGPDGHMLSIDGKDYCWEHPGKYYSPWKASRGIILGLQPYHRGTHLTLGCGEENSIDLVVPVRVPRCAEGQTYSSGQVRVFCKTANCLRIGPNQMLYAWHKGKVLLAYDDPPLPDISRTNMFFER
ncbi:MAG TPA: hypothetical protein VJJ82_02380 [Candidatus Nanoarchaeia archaeon]|nr:hypothetical protein [Candidatus Nanoarchaeia archaeon]